LKASATNTSTHPILPPNGDTPERTNFEQVLLLQRLQNAVRKINPGIPADAQAEAIKEIQRAYSIETGTRIPF